MEPFTHESRLRSWLHVLGGLAFLIGVLTLAAVLTEWPARLAASVVGALTMIRLFIFYHDYLHGSMLRGSRVAGWYFTVFGWIALAPVGIWRYSHNYHHSHVGKPEGPDSGADGSMPLHTSDVGSFPLMTIEQYYSASFWHRVMYRVSRHPLTLMLAGLTVFAFNLCLVPAICTPRKYWDGAVALAVHGGLIATLTLLWGFDVAFFAFLLPYLLASACGAFLFFVQHNYPGMRLPAEGEEWSVVGGALESSSYLQLGPLGRWFTGNIGFHHVHHLNSRIPFYKLPAASDVLRKLEPEPIVVIRKRDLITCLRLNLWDPAAGELVTYRAGKRLAAAAASNAAKAAAAASN